MMGAWRGEIEDGIGHGGLVPTKAEKEEDRHALQCQKWLQDRRDLIAVLHEVLRTRDHNHPIQEQTAAIQAAKATLTRITGIAPL